MAEFVKTVPAKRIGFVQLGDGERLDGPLDDRHPLHSADMSPLMVWARSCRVFPYEADRKAFTAQQIIFDAVRETGYDGPVSSVGDPDRVTLTSQIRNISLGAAQIRP